jgi:hypothetical protein
MSVSWMITRWMIPHRRSVSGSSAISAWTITPRSRRPWPGPGAASCLPCLFTSRRCSRSPNGIRATRRFRLNASRTSRPPSAERHPACHAAGRVGGEPRTLRNETGFRLLVAHEETGTGVTYARDRRVRRWARTAGIELLEVPQTGVVRRLATRNGWNRLWEKRMRPRAPRAAQHRTRRGRVVERLGSLGILGCRELGLPADTKDRQRGGERAAGAVLEDFLTCAAATIPVASVARVSAATSCSRLSPALAFGAISMRRVWQASEARRLDVQAALARRARGEKRSARPGSGASRVCSRGCTGTAISCRSWRTSRRSSLKTC